MVVGVGITPSSRPKKMMTSSNNKFCNVVVVFVELSASGPSWTGAGGTGVLTEGSLVTIAGGGYTKRGLGGYETVSRLPDSDGVRVSGCKVGVERPNPDVGKLDVDWRLEDGG